MRRLIIATALFFSLPACARQPIQSTSTIATKTVAAANELYASASQAGGDLVRQGLLDMAAYKRADAKAYAVLIEFRTGHATFQQLADAVAHIMGAE